MAEWAGNVTPVQHFFKKNDVGETRPNSPEEKTHDTTMQMSDDEYSESVVTIGEISVDEYFDDIFCNNNLNASAMNDISSSSEQLINEPSTVKANNKKPNEALNMLKMDVDSAYPDIVVDECLSLEDRLKNEAREAAILINQYLKSGKRVRKVKIENGVKVFVYSGLTLADVGVTAQPRFLWICNLDEHIMSSNRLLLRLPAYLSTYHVLQSFTVKRRMDVRTMNIMMEAFNTIFPGWCLHHIEQLQFEQVKERYPNRRLCEMYGVIHFVRFLTFFPYLIRAMGPFAKQYSEPMIHYVNCFIDYLEEAKLYINQDDFFHIMPDYHRMTFKTGPSKYRPKIENVEDDESIEECF